MIVPDSFSPGSHIEGNDVGVCHIRFLILLLAALPFAMTLAEERNMAMDGQMVRIDPSDYRCEDYLPPQAETRTSRRKQASPQVVQMDEWGMMELEHCDRIQRLARLTEAGIKPEFYVQRIPKDRLPAGFQQSVPVLRVVFPDRVFFDTAKATLRPEALDVARIVAESLRKEMPDVSLFVAGHTDSRGGRDYNQGLSVDRANNLAAEILRQGVNVAAVWRIGFGEDMPLVPEIDSATQGYNRRVEFLFAGRPEAIAVWLADKQLDGLCSGATQAETEVCKRTLSLRNEYQAEQLVVIRKPRRVELSTSKRKIDIPETEYRVDPELSRKIVLYPTHRAIAVFPAHSSGEKL